MIIADHSLSSYPFTESSTLLLKQYDYTMPVGIIKGAVLYPRCANTGIFYISDFNKGVDAEYYLWTISDGNYTELCTVVFTPQPISGVPVGITEDRCVGYAIQDSELCGAIEGGRELYEWLKSSPPHTSPDPTSFRFCASVVHPRPGGSARRGNLLYHDQAISQVKWTIDDNIIETDTGVTLADSPIITETPLEISQIVIRGGDQTLPITNTESVYLSSAKRSGLRVVPKNNGLTIGKLSEL